MTKLFRALIAASAVALLATGCASGPEFKDVASSIPTIKEAQGRIYFYRSGTMFGAAIQPEIHLNDQVVGKSRPGGFFYVDEPAGDYVVSTTTETTKTLSFHLDAGETKFVKTSIGLGVLVGHIVPSLESADDANRHLEGLHYTGEPTTAASK
jgi:hypothetical protein